MIRVSVVRARTFLLLGSTALAAVAVAPQARAAEADTADAAADAATAAAADDEIVVTGSRPIAESEAAALEVQRESPSLVSVVASDSVGRLPDQNIAQAVSRLPGVAVQRDQGQARYINLRGSPLNWTTLSFNGVTVVSPEGRDARFDSIPSAIASQIIVRKAVTPDLSSETIAGNIDIVTRSAFDYEGFRLAGKLGYGVIDLGDTDEYEASIVVSNRWETGIGDVGFVASGSYYERGIATDNWETDWERVSQDARPGAADRFWARETERKFYRATRANYSGSFRLDWSPTSDHRVFAEGIYTAFTDDERRDNYIFDFDDQQNRLPQTACPAAPLAQPPAGTTGYADVCTGNSPFAGTVYGIDINANILVRDFRQSIFSSTLGGDHEFGDEWKLRWRGNFSTSVDDRSAPAQFNFESPGFNNAANIGQRPTVQYDLTDRDASFIQLFRTTVGAGNQLTRGAAVASILDFNLPLNRVRSLDAKDITDAYTGKFDLSRRTDFLGETTFTFGAQVDQRTKTSRDDLLDINLAQANTAGIANTIQAYVGEDRYVGTIAPGYDVRFFDEDFLLREKDKAFAANFTRTRQVANAYEVRERVYAGYVSALTQFDWGSVLAGARLERTENRSSAVATINNVATPLTVERSDTRVFPNVNVNVDVREDQKLRLTFSTGAARPDYDVLRPNVTINDANRTISGGNPDAKPETARGVDAYYEWYIQPQGYFAIGAYYKDVDDVLFSSSRQAGDAFNSNGVDRSDYTFSGIVNGGSGYVYGFEGALQLQLDPFIEGSGVPAWLGGFGFQANATVNRSRATTPAGRRVKFPGTSDLVYNLGLYYEKYGLSVRAQYQWRDDWADFIATTDADGGDGFWRADGELDISARYAVTPSFEVFVDWANVLDGPGVRYTFDRRYTIEYEEFGTRVVGGVRVTF